MRARWCALQAGHAVLSVQGDGEPAGGVQRAVLRDHLQRPGGLHVVVTAPEAVVRPTVDVDVGADDPEVVQGVGEEDPLVLHLQDPPSQSGVVLVVLSAKQFPHPIKVIIKGLSHILTFSANLPKMLYEVGGGPGGELKQRLESIKSVVGLCGATLLD